MKFDPIRKELFTDNDEFVKKLDCPYNMNWDNLEITSSTNRNCSNCDQTIVDSSYIPENEILKMVKQNPKTCLRIDLNQNNITIISKDLLGME